MLLNLLLLFLAIPVGFLIAWLSHDELRAGRKWFFALMIFSLIGAVVFLIYGTNYASWTFGFVFIVTGISYAKSVRLKNFS